MRDIQKIIIHCSYTPASMDIGAYEIKRWHVDENGWSDIGYHYVIRRNGRIENGRPLLRDGSHTFGHNENSIGICLVGGMADDKKTPVFNFTEAQMVSLKYRVKNMLVSYPFAKVYGHNDFDPGRACPCFNVQEYFKGL